MSVLTEEEPRSNYDAEYLAPAIQSWQPVDMLRSGPDSLLGLDRASRYKLREKMLATARDTMRRYADAARRVGLPAAPLEQAADQLSGTPDRPFVLTGHQPIVFHPGLVYKYQVVAGWTASRGYQGLAIYLDTDAGDAGAFSFPVPADGRAVSRENESSGAIDAAGLRAVRAMQQTSWSEQAELYSASRLRDSAWLEAEVGRIQDALRAVGAKESAEHLAQHAAVYQRFAGQSTIAANLVARHVRNVTPGLAELPFSTFCQFSELTQVWHFLLRDSVRLHDCYNERLDAWREERKIRNPANPFPNLRREAGRYELPFWVYDSISHKRVPLWAQLQHDDWQLFGEAQSVGQATQTGLELADGLQILPRGALVSLIFRLLACDLFVHGRGGEIYDPFTDDLIRTYVGINPPPFTVASASRYLLGKQRRDLLRLEELAGQQRELSHHPHRFLESGRFSAEAERELGRLNVEKEHLVALLRTKKQAGDSAAAEGRRLQQIQDAMKQIVQRELEPRLSLLREVPEGAREAILARTYPWFFFESNWRAAGCD